MGKVKLKDLVKQVNAENAPSDGWHPEDQVAAKPKWRYRKNKDGFMGSENRIVEETVPHVDIIEANKPEAGKTYALTGGPGSRCIANGYSWKDSEVMGTGAGETENEA